MFCYADLVEGLKSLPTPADKADLSYCQGLDIKAQQLKFPDYFHFRQYLKTVPKDVFGDVSLRLMREICAKRLPEAGATFYEFTRLPAGVGYYSHWIGWDRYGDEVREPRPLDGLASVQSARALVTHPVYVLSTERELIAWRYVWGGMAYLPSDLAYMSFSAYFNKQRLIVANPPPHLLKAKCLRNAPYQTNMVRGE